MQELFPLPIDIASRALVRHADNESYYILRAGIVCVAFLGVTETDRGWCLNEVEVRPAYRGYGYATDLLEMADNVTDEPFYVDGPMSTAGKNLAQSYGLPIESSSHMSDHHRFVKDWDILDTYFTEKESN